MDIWVGRGHADRSFLCALLQRQGRSLEIFQGGLPTTKAASQNTMSLAFSYYMVDAKWMLKLYI